MFFAERIVSINPHDRVLEVGPGSNPHPRSDVLLEKIFPNVDEAAAQRAYMPQPPPNEKTVFFTGEQFPFRDGEFDYVICSHVLEHVENVEQFLGELCRVARRGYLEYPTIYYDYIYNFKCHLNFLHYTQGVIHWMPKNLSPLETFLPVQRFFYDSLSAGYDDMIVSLKESFFEGFEWDNRIISQKTSDITKLCFAQNEFNFKANPLKPTPPRTVELIKEILRRIRRRIV